MNADWVIPGRYVEVHDNLGTIVGAGIDNRIRDPGGDVVSEVAGEVTFQGSSARPGWLAGIVLGTVVQFDATEDGTYTLELVDDDSSEQLPIHVVVGAP